MANSNGQLDSRVEVVTPENIAFQYRIAGPFRRFPAYAVDMLIRIGIFLGSSALFFTIFGAIDTRLTGFALALTLVLWFILDWFYGGLFETFWNGQTPGKRMMGLRVLSIDGQPINALQAVLRNILRAVDMMPVVPLPGAGFPIPVFLLGPITCMLNDRYQRLGDLACGTMVVVEEGQWAVGLARVTETEAIRLAAYLPPGVRITRELARALSDYVDRRKVFGFARRAEIARHLAEPLRVRFNLHPETSPDLLLCALYYRAFIADKIDPDAPARMPEARLMEPPPVMASTR
jgi:uncharacterized RDD family membrane protein YckC